MIKGSPRAALPIAGLRHLPRAFTKMRFFSVLGKTCSFPGPREARSCRCSFPDRGFARSMVASHLPDVPVNVKGWEKHHSLVISHIHLGSRDSGGQRLVPSSWCSSPNCLWFWWECAICLSRHELQTHPRPAAKCGLRYKMHSCCSPGCVLLLTVVSG